MLLYYIIFISGHFLFDFYSLVLVLFFWFVYLFVCVLACVCRMVRLL